MTASRMSAFYWSNGQPSIFMGYKQFTGYATGKTASQVTAESVEKFVKKHGRNPGSIDGLSAKADAQIARGSYARRAAK